MISGLDTSGVRAELAALRSDLEEMRIAISAKIEETTAELIKWIVFMSFAEVAMTAALMRLIPVLYP